MAAADSRRFWPGYFCPRRPESIRDAVLLPQHPVAMLMLLWLRSLSLSLSLSDWLWVRSGRWLLLPLVAEGWEEMVRSRWFLLRRNSVWLGSPKLPFRSAMRVVFLAGRERWLYSSWARWAAYPSVMNCKTRGMKTGVRGWDMFLIVTGSQVCWL